MTHLAACARSNDRFVQDKVQTIADDSIKTSLITIIKRHHLQQRQHERDIETKLLQRAVKYGTKEVGTGALACHAPACACCVRDRWRDGTGTHLPDRR